MTVHRDLKSIIRARCKKTGEAYTTARQHVLRERDARLGSGPGHGSDHGITEAPARVEAVVLKVNRRSVRVRILGEDAQVTFRTERVDELVPGHLVTLEIDGRWPWREHEYASGTLANPRIAVHEIGLVPLPLHGGRLEDLRAPFGSDGRDPEQPDAELWLRATAEPRPCFEMDPIAWGELDGDDPEDNPTCIAADLAEVGDVEAAHKILMDALCTDLRCIDAHAHLGNLEFDRSPRQAMLHYEVGTRIAELSLPAGFDGVLPWAYVDNRPLLRCLHGLGLCLWRLGEHARAQAVFERMLALNPNDNQGARFCWDDVRRGRSWTEFAGADS